MKKSASKPNYRKSWTALLLLILSFLWMPLNSAAEDDKNSYILSTASTGGTYYPVGVGISSLVKVYLTPKKHITLVESKSAGSGENIKRLQDGDAQFAILEGISGYYAWNGKGLYQKTGKIKSLRSVSMLWEDVAHYIIKKEKIKSGTIDDIIAMKGAKIAMGAKGSGTLSSNASIMKNFGVDIYKDYDLFYGGYQDAALAFQEGKIDGFAISGGLPVKVITSTLRQMLDKAVILTFSSGHVDKIQRDLKVWTPYTIKKETYPGLENDVQTISQPNFLAVREDVDEEVVYQVTKHLYEHLNFLQRVHKATTAMEVSRALRGLSVPLHPGAIRYYKEAGIEIPKELLSAK